MWNTNDEHYLCQEQGRIVTVLQGPMRSGDVVNLIVSFGNLKAQQPYSNASRHFLAKCGAYPRTKAGNAKLAADIERNAILSNSLVTPATQL